MHIKSCYVPKEKAHTKIYQEIQQYKQARKGVLCENSENINASISSLQHMSSHAIESTIHRSSKSITSSNKTYAYEILSFKSASNIKTGSNTRNVSNGSLIFGTDENYQKSITSNETHMDIAIADLIISEGLSFTPYQKPR